MTVTEKIQAYLEKLPQTSQAEVLDFVEYLFVKTTRDARDTEEELWGTLSIASAMRGMEDEDSPQYTKADLEVPFS